MPGAIDAILILIFGGVAYAVANEGAWGAILMAISVIFAGLFAMNFFEPTANFLENTVGLTGTWTQRTDFIALVGLFAGAVGLLRLMTLKLSPDDFVVHPGFNDIGRWLGGLLAGWVTMAFLLAALHTAPAPREFLGFTPERRNLLNIAAPDRQWLGFTQYCSEHAFANYETVNTGGVTSVQRRVFDAPYMAVPGQDETRWSSFPIRYATRREQISGGAVPPLDDPAPGGTPAGSGDPGGDPADGERPAGGTPTIDF